MNTSCTHIFGVNSQIVPQPPNPKKFMKSKSNLFLPLFAIVFTVGLSPLQAVDIDTTGTTITLNTDAPGNKYLGDGTLQVSADANASIDLGTGGGSPQTYFYMTGGLITIDSGVKLVNGGWSKGTWINGTIPNKADMAVNGTLDLWDGNPVYVDALTGAGAINVSLAYGTGFRQLHVGVAGGGGTYSGSIHPGNTTRGINIIKSGSGIQTFDNLANQTPKNFILNDGVVNLSVPDGDSAILASGFSGVGNLTKSGAGMLTLSGTVTHTGVTTVSEGTLSMGENLTSPNWVIASGAVLDLNFYGQKAVTSLKIAGSGPLPPGLYDSSHSIYGSYFSGSGSLRILGDIPLNSGVWTSLTDGDWTNGANWQGNTIASGAGNTATFNAAADVTVTLDAGVTMGHLAFDVSNYTISGSNILTRVPDKKVNLRPRTNGVVWHVGH
jgi:autotransporter-associated beta strand protein